jgi:glucose-1-phosphate thymidylyltransferase
MVACPEEIAFRRRWITADQMQQLAAPLLKNAYGRYLQNLLSEAAWPST